MKIVNKRIDKLYREYPMDTDKEFRKYTIIWDFWYLTLGRSLKFFDIVNNSKISTLYKELVDNGFIGSETNIYHFGILFGIPLHESETPFKQIRWLKNGQLFRYFFHWLFSESKEASGYKSEKLWASLLFNDRYGKEYKMQEANKARLIEPDFSQLKGILTRFREEQ